MAARWHARWRQVRGGLHDGGASAVEYGLVVFAIAAVIAIAVFALGPPVLGMYADTCTAIQGPAPGTTQSC